MSHPRRAEEIEQLAGIDVYRLCYLKPHGKPYFNPIGTVARVLTYRAATGMLGSSFTIYLVRFVGSKRDRWVVRVRDRVVLYLDDVTPEPEPPRQGTSPIERSRVRASPGI